MKQLLSVFTLAAVMVACNSNPKKGVDSFIVTPTVEKPAVTTTDTAGLAQYQAWKAQHELAKPNEYKSGTTPAVTSTTHSPVHKTTRAGSTHSGSNNTATTSNGAMSSQSSNTAMRKKGWSKAAEGTAIGAGTGAVIGAVISKNNRASGAVIGGVIGAGAGYGIGRSKDKKDGRY